LLPSERFKTTSASTDKTATETIPPTTAPQEALAAPPQLLDLPQLDLLEELLDTPAGSLVAGPLDSLLELQEAAEDFLEDSFSSDWTVSEITSSALLQSPSSTSSSNTTFH